MTPLIECLLAIFLVVIIVAISVLTVFVVKLLQETTATIANLKDITETTKKEIEPALKSVNNVLSTASDLSLAANKNFNLVKNILTTLLGASYVAFSKAKGNSFINGILSGFNLFSKKRR